MTRPAQLEPFHRIADAGSARVRRFVVDHALEDRVRFRNVAYPEAESALQGHGGAAVPALWDGERLLQGAEAIVARLQAVVDIGRSG